MEGVLSVWGSLGRPQALLGGAPAPAPAAAAAPGPSPAPPLDASSQAIAHAHVRTHAQIDEPKRGIYLCSLILWVDLCLGVGLLNHTLLPILVPSGTSIIFSIPALPTPIPTHRGGEFPLLHIFSSIGY